MDSNNMEQHTTSDNTNNNTNDNTMLTTLLEASTEILGGIITRGFDNNETQYLEIVRLYMSNIGTILNMIQENNHIQPPQQQQQQPAGNQPIQQQQPVQPPQQTQQYPQQFNINGNAVSNSNSNSNGIYTYSNVLPLNMLPRPSTNNNNNTPRTRTRTRTNLSSRTNDLPLMYFMDFVTTIGNTNTNTNRNDDNFMTNFNNLFGSFFNPVPIIPTQEQIRNSTRDVIFGDYFNSDIHESCPIDLTPFNNDDNVTEILHCHHVFKRDSLMRWFNTSPSCPVCRYDIRTYTPTEEDRQQ